MITLKDMTLQEFDDFIKTSIPAFATELEKTGEFTKEQADESAQRQYTELLPDGIASEGHYFLNIDEEDRTVGILWVAMKNENGKISAFIYDLEIYESERGKGAATQAMHKADAFSREKGAEEIWLHVFASNTIAFHLYENLGYRIRKTFYSKDEKNIMSFRMAKSLID
ncbi:MAG: GNAT family N-acetyltransferase [Anaerolineaceae bacterium]